jgi:MOSC domain-containing protein YiiM
MASSLQDLRVQQYFTGQLEWIGLRPKKKGELQSVEQATVGLENGLEGDHYGRKQGKRQVTLIQAEHLVAVAALLRKPSVDPSLLRRNLVISGINLLSLKDQTIRIGAEVTLEITGPCYPCSRMEENLGPGGYQAMRGHGGVTARVIQGGEIRIGDRISGLIGGKMISILR